MFRLSNASLMIFLGSVVASTACGGNYSNPGGGSQAKPLTNVSVYAQSAPSIPVSGTVKLIANGTYGDPTSANPYKDVTSSATWTSSDPAVASVAAGQVTGTGVGSASIKAGLGGFEGLTTVVVGLTPSITIKPHGNGAFSLAHPQRQFYATATYSDSTVLDLTNFVKWSASPTGVIEFDDPYGLEPGLATFLATGFRYHHSELEAGEEETLAVTVDP